MPVTERRAPSRGWLLDTSPLGESPAFRRFWVSGVASGIGHQLTAVAIAIHVYELSGSTAAVALVGGFALAPMAIMGIVGGSIVDAFDRRRVLLAASFISFIAPVGIAALAWTHVEVLWPYYVFTTLSSTVGSLVGAARFAIHPRLVRRDQLPAVAALSGVSAGLQTAVGPALAGLLVAAFGFAWTYTIDVALFMVGFWGVVSLPPIAPERATRVGLTSLREGARFLRGAANLRAAFVLQIATLTFGRPYAILPAVGAVLIGGGPLTVGLLTASAAVGVILSGLVSGRLGSMHAHGRGIARATVGFAAAVAIFGALLLVLELRGGAPADRRMNVAALAAVAAALVLAGVAENIASIFRTTMMQSATPDEVRGRLQGMFTLVLTAGPRSGDVYAGFLAAAAMLWWPPLLGAVLIVAVVGAVRLARPQFWQYDGRTPVP